MYTQSALTAETRQKKRRRGLLPGLLALVLVAAVGTGGWLVRGGGDDGTHTPGTRAAVAQGPLDVREAVERGPASPAGKKANHFSVDDPSPGEHYEMPGMWATDRIGTDAYAMDSGRRLWRTTSTGSCQDMGAAGGGALLVRQERHPLRRTARTRRPRARDRHLRDALPRRS